MQDNNVEFGSGVKAWLIVCIVFNAIGCVSGLAMGLFPSAILCGVQVGLIAWLLKAKKRMAFYSLIALAVVAVIVNIVIYKMGPTAFSGLLGPVVTYLVISKYWPQMD